jgi:hypothetical protein
LESVSKWLARKPLTIAKIFKDFEVDDDDEMGNDD